jgi:hypothetical protein
LNFKGVQSYGGKSGKFTKIISELDLHEYEFSWAHLYARKKVLIQVSTWLGLSQKIRIKKIEFQTEHHIYFIPSLFIHAKGMVETLWVLQ